MAESAGDKNSTNSLLDLCLLIKDLFLLLRETKRKVSAYHFQKVMMGSETIEINILYFTWNLFFNSMLVSA